MNRKWGKTKEKDTNMDSWLGKWCCDGNTNTIIT